VATRIADDTLSASWLASRFAIEPFKLEAMRRDGEVIAFRPAGSREHYYPLWQFDDEGRPLPIIPRLVQEARERGLRGNRLYEVLSARAGIQGDGKLADSLREGRFDHVVDAIRTARP
jgi:hypothetical protein